MTNPTSNAITANIALIEKLAARVWVLADAAHQAARQGEMNLAIGTLLPAAQDLSDAQALMNTVFVIHRSRPAEKGGAQ